MTKVFYILVFYFVVGTQAFYAQISNELIIAKDTVKASKTIVYDPLRPSKAAFYSAIVPGLGQAYNKKYWKIPIVYGAIGASMYFYLSNNKKYHQARDAYKLRLQGLPDEFEYLDNDRLIRAQQFYQRNRDLSLLVTAVFYVLNIVDANVDAHLMQFNVNDKLSFVPDLQQNDFTSRPNLGFSLNYKF